MPTFAVHIKVAGPFRDLADGKRFSGAYSHRYVVAADAKSAERQAIESLKKEQQFAQLRPVDGIGSPPTEVDEVRKVPWYEGFFSNKALVLQRKRPDPQS
ncbi:MAG: hypothetical protein AAFX44_04470 [Pseudomonadota bacterium]